MEGTTGPAPAEMNGVGDGWEPVAGRAGPLTVVAAALWAGLLAGFVELGLFEARVRWAQHGFYRRSGHVLWMIPVADLALFGFAGLLVALVVRPLPKIGRTLAAWALCTLAIFAPMLAIPGIRGDACLALAGGLACWVAPAVRAHAGGFRRMVRATLPVLGVVLLGLGVTAFGRAASAARVGGARGTAPRGSPNVLFLVMDTVRADATSLRGPGSGPGRNTTPNLAALATRGARFDRAVAPSPWTLPSHASMFTGRWPWELSVGTDRALDGRYPTLAEYLGARGYATGGFAANTVFCTTEYGLARGFGHFEDFIVSPLDALRSSALGWLICRRLVTPIDRLYTAAGREPVHPLEQTTYRKSADEVNQAALSWIAEQRNAPFFAFLNYLDAHDPYLVPAGADRPFTRRPATPAERRVLRDWIGETPRPRTPEEVRLARDSYDDCLAYLDGRIGRLLAGLERLGRLEDTVIVVTSDHGEHFGEHARDGLPLVGHRQSVYQPEVHVPLVIVAPGRVAAGTTVPGAVSLRDLPATVVDLVGLRDGSPFPGRSIIRPPSDPTVQGDGNAALAEFSPSTDRPATLRYQTGAPGLMRAVVTDGAAYVTKDGREELYDLRDDPAESTDLSASGDRRGLLDQLRSTLNVLGPPAPAVPRRPPPGG